MEWYQYEEKELYQTLKSTAQGLHSEQIKGRQERDGLNELSSEKPRSPLKAFISQFKSLVVIILLIASIISFSVGHNVEFYVLLAIVLFIVILNFFMEYSASQAIDSLRKLTPKNVIVLRDGKRETILSQEVCVGDILILEAGGMVSADARIIHSSDLQVDESVLTGESLPVHKQKSVIPQPAELSKQSNMVFSGTPIVHGKGLAIVVAIGNNTQFGKISSLIKGVHETQTPLQRRLKSFTLQISFIAGVIAMILFFVGLHKGHPLGTMIIYAMAILVAGIPESFPTVLAITLASGVRRMAKQNAIVKRIPAVETLGTCSIICSDKTGTITQNKMVVNFISLAKKTIHVGGQGYEPRGTFMLGQKEIVPLEDEDLSTLLHIGILCNDSDIEEKDNQWTSVGEPTESALVTLAHKASLLVENIRKSDRKIKEFPFDSERKCMSVISTFGKKRKIFAKGAPEVILSKSVAYLSNGRHVKLTAKQKAHFLELNRSYAEKGLRVLALAYRDVADKQLKHLRGMHVEEAESKLVFVGFVAMRDPPEDSVKASVLNCQSAGIKVIMITGDNEITAKAIAEEVGIFRKQDRIVTGRELNEMTEEELLQIIDEVSVFARVTPEHKLRIVTCLQKKEHIVAMTGDGVNDAPALKKADIGVAMGRAGTEVAKESADLILKDDNFTTIANAVEQGRGIYENIRKFTYYMLVGNFSLLLILLITGLLGKEAPLSAIMILFMNLIISDFSAIGLSFEKVSPTVMHRKPRNPQEPLLTSHMLVNIFSLVPLIVIAISLLYQWSKNSFNDPLVTQTMIFLTLILFMLFHTFNSRSWSSSIFEKGFFSNPFVLVAVCVSMALTVAVVQIPGLFFATAPLTTFQWVVCLLVSSSIFVFVEFKKVLVNLEVEEYLKGRL